jgi:hypothetical protein
MSSIKDALSFVGSPDYDEPSIKKPKKRPQRNKKKEEIKKEQDGFFTCK